MKDIIEFQGEYRWLSNFWFFEKPLVEDGIEYKTNEHYYMAMKVMDVNTRKLIANHPLKGLKRFANSFPLRDDWDDIRKDVMYKGLCYKFSDNNPTLKRKLISTKDCYIQEGNMWGDKFWGVCLRTGKGENNLGKLIMKVRGEITK